MDEALINKENVRILLANDDGIDAPGLKILETVANTLSSEVWIVAPVKEQSATGHSLTLRRPLRIIKRGQRRFAVNGTPTDCVLLAVNQIMKHCKPDLVLSGVNKGRNVGEDMTYSGTVAAAMEATLFGIPAIALSQDMNEEDHRDLSQNTKRIYSAAQGYAAQVIKKVTQVAWQKDVLINVNFPAVLSNDVRGIEVTREGRSNKLSDEIIEHRDPRDKRYYWIGQRRGSTKHPVGTDINAIECNAISITPISMNLTHKPTIKILKGVFGSD